MRVICIKPFITKDRAAYDNNRPSPEVGDIDIVTEIFDWFGRKYYALERFSELDGYAIDHFATLPDEDADQMKEEVREAIVNIETPVI